MNKTAKRLPAPPRVLFRPDLWRLIEHAVDKTAEPSSRPERQASDLIRRVSFGHECD